MKIAVPDIKPPRKTLCWKASETLVRCDRMEGHQGPHSWEPRIRMDAQGQRVEGP